MLYPEHFSELIAIRREAERVMEHPDADGLLCRLAEAVARLAIIVEQSHV